MRPTPTGPDERQGATEPIIRKQEAHTSMMFPGVLEVLQTEQPPGARALAKCPETTLKEFLWRFVLEILQPSLRDLLFVQQLTHAQRVLGLGEQSGFSGGIQLEDTPGGSVSQQVGNVSCLKG